MHDDRRGPSIIDLAHLGHGLESDVVTQGGSRVARRSRHYLNDLISTFVERDIVAAASIEKRAAFTHVLQLVTGRIGLLLNAAELGGIAGVELTTVQSWISILEDNGILLRLKPYYTNLNKRLIKTPKLYFMDTGLATRLQGWTELQPLLSSPLAGHLLGNIVVGEVARCFVNRGFNPNLAFVRSKEKVEVDLLVQLPNQRVLAIEVKTSALDSSEQQMALLDSLQLNIVGCWIVAQTKLTGLRHGKVVLIEELWDELAAVF